jgi:gamma-glutamyltranspeptidase/glutathione hydrolase
MTSLHRPIVMSEAGIVVAGHHRAAEAGAAMLRSGGNAMDAAVTAAAALAVVVPHMNGLGGDAIALWYSARDHQVVAINGTGAAPGAVTTELYRARGFQEVPQRGPLSISVPGVVHGWASAIERFGTKSLSEVLAPATALAETGLFVDPVLGQFFGGATYRELAASFPNLARTYGSPGSQQLGMRITQPLLAETLRMVARDGPSSFYGGALGRALVEDVGNAGGVLDLQDLASHATLFQNAIEVGFRGRVVHAAPPNSQGLALLALLGILDQTELPADEGALLAQFLSVKLVAFEWRDRYVGDPDRFDLPPGLLDRENLLKATNKLGRMPVVSPGGGGDTSSLVVIDRDGNAVSWVQSLFEEFGSGVVSAQTGIVLHNRLWGQTLDNIGPRALRPRQRPFHTLCPALVLGGDNCELAIATPGDHGQPQALAQVMLNMYVRGMTVQEAIEYPRIRHDAGRDFSYESRIPDIVIRVLERQGYVGTNIGPWARPMGGVNAILRSPDGMLLGGADPRRASYAVSM